MLLFLLYRWEKWGPERLSNFLGSCKCQSQYSNSGSLSSNPYFQSLLFSALLLKLWTLNLKLVKRYKFVTDSIWWRHSFQPSARSLGCWKQRLLMKKTWTWVSSFFAWGCLLSHPELGVLQYSSAAHHPVSVRLCKLQSCTRFPSLQMPSSSGAAAHLHFWPDSYKFGGSHGTSQ